MAGLPHRASVACVPVRRNLNVKQARRCGEVCVRGAFRRCVSALRAGQAQGAFKQEFRGGGSGRDDFAGSGLGSGPWLCQWCCTLQHYALVPADQLADLLTRDGCGCAQPQYEVSVGWCR